MFSVDNFYEIFNSHYCWPEKNNMIRIFWPHGSKNWASLKNYGLALNRNDHKFAHINDLYRINGGGIIVMHDQEPIDMSNIEYYQPLSDEYDQEFKDRANSVAGQFESLSATDFIHIKSRTVSFPIVCHSELNSESVRILEQNNIPTCYYWWHGMIARDWFRHQHRDNIFKIQNKAMAEFRFLIYSRAFDGSRIYREKVIQHLEKYKSKVNYNWSQQERSPTLSAHIDRQDAVNSAIHVVAETLFDTDKIYLTEKVFKPMVMSQPFLLFGPPGSLKLLQDYGFQTFSTVWDESYDLDQDHESRREKVLKVIDNLAVMSDSAFSDLYELLLPIIQHNRDHFYSDAFQERLWQELRGNMDLALLRQQTLLTQFPQGSFIKTVGEFADTHGYIDDFWKIDLRRLIKEDPLYAQRIRVYHPKLWNLLE